MGAVPPFWGNEILFRGNEIVSGGNEIRKKTQMSSLGLRKKPQLQNIMSSSATQGGHNNVTKLECGPMPNLMVALPNIGGALCSTPQSLANAHY